ncbi:hypothetical protein ACHWQZ_G010175 [Mnemiopsis leidyi]
MTTIEGLLKRLKTSENDSEKFALLIVISKVVKPDLMNPELQEKLSQAVSFKFVFRLLNVDSTRENAALYWQIAAAVLKTCFLSQDYFRSLLGCAERLIQITQESDEADLLKDVHQIFHFLIHEAKEEQGIQIFKMLLANITASECIVSWCPLISTLYKKLLELGHSSIDADRILILVAEKLISNIETESPTSVDKNLNLTVGVTQLVSGSHFLYQRIPSFSVVLSCTENLLKSKIPAEKQQILLQVAPFLTEVLSCRSWSGNKMFYNLASIELKLALEEIVHRFEESGEVLVSEICMKSIVSCCGTIENCIGELVDSENNQMDGKLLQSLIDDIRMAMTSAMFYLQKGLTQQGVFIPVLRLLMRWLSDDSAEVDQIIATFNALKDFYKIPKSYSEFGNFIVSAVIFRMEDKKFREYVEKYELLGSW